MDLHTVLPTESDESQYIDLPDLTDSSDSEDSEDEWSDEWSQGRQLDSGAGVSAISDTAPLRVGPIPFGEWSSFREWRVNLEWWTCLRNTCMARREWSEDQKLILGDGEYICSDLWATVIAPFLGYGCFVTFKRLGVTDTHRAWDSLGFKIV